MAGSLKAPLIVTGVGCAAVVVAMAQPGCASRVRVPEQGLHTDADMPVFVAEPPPEARVESVAKSPDARMVWVDGYWMWRGRGWSWHAGQWQLPPPDAYYAPSMLIRMPVAVYDTDAGKSDAHLAGYGMQLMYVPGHWHARSGAILPEPEAPQAPAASIE